VLQYRKQILHMTVPLYDSAPSPMHTQNTKNFVEIIFANDIQFEKFRPDVQFRPAIFMVLSSMRLNFILLGTTVNT